MKISSDKIQLMVYFEAFYSNRMNWLENFLSVNILKYLIANFVIFSKKIVAMYFTDGNSLMNSHCGLVPSTSNSLCLEIHQNDGVHVVQITSNCNEIIVDNLVNITPTENPSHENSCKYNRKNIFFNFSTAFHTYRVSKVLSFNSHWKQNNKHFIISDTIKKKYYFLQNFFMICQLTFN